jgi:hypothetical protein
MITGFRVIWIAAHWKSGNSNAPSGKGSSQLERQPQVGGMKKEVLSVFFNNSASCRISDIRRLVAGHFSYLDLLAYSWGI